MSKLGPDSAGTSLDPPHPDHHPDHHLHHHHPDHHPDHHLHSTILMTNTCTGTFLSLTSPSWGPEMVQHLQNVRLLTLSEAYQGCTPPPILIKLLLVKFPFLRVKRLNFTIGTTDICESYSE